VVFLVFGFFFGPKLGIYKCTVMLQHRRSSRFAPRNIRTFGLSSSFPLFSKSCCCVRPLFPRLDILFKTLDVALQPLDGRLERLNASCKHAVCLCGDTPRIVETHVDVLAQQLVRHPILVHDVVVETCAGDGGAEQESEDTIGRRQQSSVYSPPNLVATFLSSYPTLKGPIACVCSMDPAGVRRQHVSRFQVLLL
jgi:hypothetical protein